jgi:2-dehydro-3-deoxyphosphogluconate aldolase/(4S)-4-hydroxy-2-oxoglutarate aldolase
MMPSRPASNCLGGAANEAPAGTAPLQSRQDDLLRYLTRVRILPVVEFSETGHAVPMARALADAGLTCIEVTLRTAQAADSIAAIAAHAPDVLVGAGTVRTTDDADIAVAAGARFLVAPGFSSALVKRSLGLGVPMIPGVLTPTEIQAATGLGMRLLKLFPAEAAGGVAYLKALSGPFRDVRFVPTGGISPDNLTAYLDLPLVAACGGSWMAPADLIAAGDFTAIARLARQAAQIAGVHRQAGS